ncbi:MAG: Ig-like domain-containing protein, partial [Methanobrevibacter sp.]|nr:Ig-like domain-containing protein [Methanobrevibacter sp.]
DYNDIMFEITLPKIATGNMTVTLNGNTSTFNVSEKGIVEDRIRTMTWRNAFLPVGQYNMAVSYSGDRNFKPAAFNVTSYILPLSVELSINATSSLYVGNTTKIEYNITPSGLNGTLTFESSNPQVATVDSNGTITAVGGGTAIITASYWVSENYTNPKANITVIVNRLASQINADPVATTYNVNRDLVVTLTDAKGNPLSGLKVTVMFDDAGEYTTGNNGQIRVNVANLVPKTYNVKITFPGNSAYVNSTCSVKVTVKKATPKLIAKKKTYKAKTKAKKYTITLKDNKGKAIRNAKVWISIKKITKKAKAVKTNAKGKATLKFSKSKKGKYVVTIKFKANKYYSSVTKKVKITIR